MTTCPTPHRNDEICCFCVTEPVVLQCNDMRNAVLIDEAQRIANSNPVQFAVKPIAHFSRQNRRSMLRQVRQCIEVYFRDKGAL